MTINQYLWYLEWLQIKRDKKYENYMRLAEKVVSPQSSLHNDGMPRSKDVRCEEKKLLKSSEALEAYYDADRDYWDYINRLRDQLQKLEYRDRIALETTYIYNLDKPMGKRTSDITKFLDIKKRDIPELMKEAKEHLRELLISEGIEIE